MTSSTYGRTPLPGPPARVLIVEALPLAGLGLRTLIENSREFTACGTATRVDVALAARARPDLVLVDSALDVDASRARELMAAHPSVGVVGLVRPGGGAVPYLKAAARVGVRGLIRRSADPGVILTVLRIVRSGRTVVDPALTAALEGGGGSPVTPLSGRQADVLTLVARGYDTPSIARALNVSVETVRTHVKAVLARLDARDRAHAVARGYQLGFLELPSDPHAQVPIAPRELAGAPR